MAERLHLPFPVLVDERLELTRELGLPTFETSGWTLLKRLTLVIDDGRIEHVFYPIFPPDTHRGGGGSLTLAEAVRRPRPH